MTSFEIFSFGGRASDDSHTQPCVGRRFGHCLRGFGGCLAGTYLERKQGGLLLIMLSLAMLTVGGGSVPPLFGIAAGTLGVLLNYNMSKHGVGSI
jgi:hypothetical protein